MGLCGGRDGEFCLFPVAEVSAKKAAALLTVSDHALTRKKISAEERQNSFRSMIETALLGAVLRLEEMEKRL